MEWFYDRSGKAVLFMYDERLISKYGKNLCWVIDGYLYGLRSGKHIGWIEDGKVYDINNDIIAFVKGASGLPHSIGLQGVPGTPGIPSKPGKPSRGSTKYRSYSRSYSNYDAISYFENNQ